MVIEPRDRKNIILWTEVLKTLKNELSRKIKKAINKGQITNFAKKDAIVNFTSNLKFLMSDKPRPINIIPKIV